MIRRPDINARSLRDSIDLQIFRIHFIRKAINGLKTQNLFLEMPL